MHWTLLSLLAAAAARPQGLTLSRRSQIALRGGASDAVAQPTSLEELKLLCEKEEGVCVVDFGATWCGPCQKIAPVFDALAEGCPDALFAKVDVDEMPDASQHYGVSALPTFLVFKDSAEVARIQGADEQGLRAALDKAGCPPPKNDIF
jgi:thioredoxin